MHSDRYGNPRCDGYLNLIARRIGYGFAMLDQTFDDHLNHFANILERFLFGLSPGCGALAD